MPLPRLEEAVALDGKGRHSWILKFLDRAHTPKTAAAHLALPPVI